MGISGTNYPVIDGGNWLGDSVTMLNDGTFLFHTMAFDTVKIKTRANVGDSWTFYNDASIHSYKATVLSIDTMTVLDSLDSVKTIQINAYASGLLDASDPLNSFQIKLGKRFGFVQVFDLYTFPYHFPPLTDYFYEGVGSTPSDQIFHLVRYHNPNALEIYNFNPGDVFERQTTTVNSWMTPCDGHDTYQSLFIDSVIAKIVTDATHIKYAIHHKGHESSTSGYFTYDLVDTLYATTVVLYVNDMPESCPDINFYYFFPNDTSWCNNSSEYQHTGAPLCGNNYPPYCISFEAYKDGFGLVSRVTDIDGTYGCEGMALSIRYENLIFAFKNGDSCGTYVALYPPVDTSAYVKNLNHQRIEFQIFPNPATNELNIKMTTSQPYTITLINMMGQIVTTKHNAKPEETINVSHLPAGVYNVSITDEDGNRVNERVVVER